MEEVWPSGIFPKFVLDHSCQENLPAALEAVLEKTQDFTDSAYTSHEHREAILESSERLKAEVDHLLGLYANIVSTPVTFKIFNNTST